MLDALALFRLNGKLAVVTGGTSGIGRCTAEHFASAGASVAVVARHIDACRAVAEELASVYGVKARGYACDVSDEEQVDRLYDAIAREMGIPTILHNNAGINVNGGALDLKFSDWQRMMDVNVNGIFLMARGLARKCVAAGKQAAIVNTASISASIVNLPQWQTAYNTSKGAVRHLTKTLAVEWAEYGIRVNAVSPGYVWTEMNQVVPKEITDVWMAATPMHRFATPDEIASAVLYLASDAAGYTTGSELLVDGGFTSI